MIVTTERQPHSMTINIMLLPPDTDGIGKICELEYIQYIYEI